ncbi:MAG: peptidoglycan editing factor PgeF [Salinivirgaceae bacterium]|nr:peptidoglycan editing factor PgeF [Salinivirgaceae bacterium]MDD4747490.1 peptidoglycan editing factor PgeF [Salinivirgaceae bacterium]MDY0280675.1 peptidoglycan editing factor PgeF [Salinivirgaceae bacterium]
MILNQETKIYHYKSLTDLGIINGTTTRNSLNYDDFNLSSKIPDLERKEGCRSHLSKVVFNKMPIVFPKQTSSDSIWIAGNDKEPVVEADAIITRNKNIAIGILTADCVPIILYDIENQALALVHAGWRGAAANLVAKTITLLHNTFNTNPQNLYATIGPAISMKNYEVGEEVAQLFMNNNYPNHVITPNENQKYMLDLWGATHFQMTEAGVLEDKIEMANICTYDSALFYSARRDGIQTGRFATIAALPYKT